MRFLLIYIGFFAVLSQPLFARTITIKSGEHDGFSRLVIYTKRTEQAKLVKTETGLLLSVDPSGHFDFSQVFKFIDRNRISEISHNPRGELEITIRCSCDMSTETLSSGHVVIDIADSLMSPEFTEDPETTKLAATQTHEQSARTTRAGLPITINENHLVVTKNETEDVSNEQLPPKTPDAAMTNQINKNSLLLQLTRAASQGMVQVREDELPVDHSESDEAVSTKPEPTANPHSSNKQVQIQTSIDRDAGEIQRRVHGEATHSACLPNETFAIGTWGDASSLRLDFTEHQIALKDRLSSPDSYEIERFLKHQLFLTLGAEALAYLNAFTDPLPDRNNLQLMAEILETGSASEFARMTQYLSCEGPVALWATLAHARLPRDHDINTSGVVAEYSQLPRHLRVHIGPMLMRKLLAIGDTTTATEINAIMQRGANLSTDTAVVIDAELSEMEGKPLVAKDKLEHIVNADNVDSVDALLLLVENQIEQNEGIADRTLELLATFKHEHQRTETGTKLAIAELRALIHAARFDEAFGQLASLKETAEISQNQQQDLLNEFGKKLTSAASDGVFLRYMLGGFDWSQIPESTRISQSKRLLEDGFFGEAKHLLAKQDAPPSREARLLIAEAAFSQGEGKIALGYLAGLQGPKAEQLRSQILDISNFQPARPQQTIGSENDPNVGQRDAPSLASLQALIDGSSAIRGEINQSLEALGFP